MIMIAILSLLISIFYAFKVLRIPIGKEIEKKEEKKKLLSIHKAIATGASTFITQQTKALLIFIFFFGLFIYFIIDNPTTLNIQEGLLTGVAFVFGSLTSMLSGFIGMKNCYCWECPYSECG